MMVKRKLGICYCRNMRRATSAITDIYDEILKPSGLRVNQFAILINLSRLIECSVSELADVLSLERTSLVRALKPLYDKKLLEDVSDSEERNCRIRLTKEGVTAVKVTQPLWQQAQTHIEEKIGQANVQTLMKILSLLTE